MNELISLEEEHPDLKTPDSPSVRVGGVALSEFSQVDHTTPLLSLDNSYNEEDLKDFDTRIKKDIEEEYQYIVEYKN